MDQVSSRFLSAFNAIEQHLRELMASEQHRSFGEMVHCASHSNALVRRLSSELRHLAELRNFLVHRFKETEPLAVPSPLSLKKVERIRDALLQPSLLHTMFHKVVICCRPDEPIGNVVQRMHEHNFSQLPVYDGKQFVGILNSDTVARWLAAGLASGVGLVEEDSVATVLEHRQTKDQHEFASHRATIVDAFHIVEERHHRGKQLSAILLSPHGKETELPTGIVTVGDLPLMLEAVGI